MSSLCGSCRRPRAVAAPPSRALRRGRAAAHGRRLAADGARPVRWMAPTGVPRLHRPRQLRPCPGRSGTPLAEAVDAVEPGMPRAASRRTSSSSARSASTTGRPRSGRSCDGAGTATASTPITLTAAAREVSMAADTPSAGGRIEPAPALTEDWFAAYRTIDRSTRWGRGRSSVAPPSRSSRRSVTVRRSSASAGSGSPTRGEASRPCGSTRRTAATPRRRHRRCARCHGGVSRRPVPAPADRRRQQGALALYEGLGFVRHHAYVNIVREEAG